MFDPWLERLQQVDWVCLNYRLRLSEAVDLPAWALLRLRRELAAVAKAFPQQGYSLLLRPSLPDDPRLLRQVQQPAPGFILSVDQPEARTVVESDQMTLIVCFVGLAIAQVSLFSQFLVDLGQVGLYCHRGRYVVEQIDSATAPGLFSPIWRGGSLHLTPRIFALSELIDDSPPPVVHFEFCTPARLLKQGKPLFRATFAEIFPFILRRTTSLLAVWGQVEQLFDSVELQRFACRLSCSHNRLVWHDWRPLGPHDEAGGLCGSLHLHGEELAPLWPVLRLGELFGVGKSAAFGAGRYVLIGHMG
jgi:hypothetical protein